MGGLARYFGGGLDFLWDDAENPPSPYMTEELRQRLELEKQQKEQEEAQRNSIPGLVKRAWEGFKEPFEPIGRGLDQLMETDLYKTAAHRSGIPQAWEATQEFVSGPKRALDIGAGLLTDEDATGIVDPKRGNEAGQLAFNLVSKGLDPYEMVTDPIGKTPLQESEA